MSIHKSIVFPHPTLDIYHIDPWMNLKNIINLSVVFSIYAINELNDGLGGWEIVSVSVNNHAVCFAHKFLCEHWIISAFILLWWWDWHNSLRYIKLQVNNKRLCSQSVLVFKWITLVTSVSQGELWFSYNFHIDIIYLVVAIYKIRQPLNIWKYEASCLHLI
jgi:hypothetical protein